MPGRTPQGGGHEPERPAGRRSPVKTSDGFDPETAVLVFFCSGVAALIGLAYLICRKGGRKE